MLVCTGSKVGTRLKRRGEAATPHTLCHTMMQAQAQRAHVLTATSMETVAQSTAAGKVPGKSLSCTRVVMCGGVCVHVSKCECE